MTWNYRLIRYPKGGVGIHEVYYEGKKVKYWTVNAMDVYGDNRKDCLSVYLMMHEAFKKPVLNLAKLEKALRG